MSGQLGRLFSENSWNERIRLGAAAESARRSFEEYPAQLPRLRLAPSLRPVSGLDLSAEGRTTEGSKLNLNSGLKENHASRTGLGGLLGCYERSVGGLNLIMRRGPAEYRCPLCSLPGLCGIFQRNL